MKRFNWLRAAPEPMGDSPEGFGGSCAEISRVVGAEHMIGSLYEVPPGHRLFPYHWEAAQEEWLLVLAGTPTVRTPEETRELRAGDLVCFVPGPDGAHQVSNESGEPARILMLSDRAETNLVVYPDSSKMAVEAPGHRAMYRMGDGPGYWEGE